MAYFKRKHLFKQPSNFPKPLTPDGNIIKTKDPALPPAPAPYFTNYQKQRIDTPLLSKETIPRLSFLRLLATFAKRSHSEPSRCLRPIQLCSLLVRLVMCRAVVKNLCHLVQILQINGPDLYFAFPYLSYEELACYESRSALDPQLVLSKEELKDVKSTMNEKMTLEEKKNKGASKSEQVDFTDYKETFTYCENYLTSLFEGKTLKKDTEDYRRVRQLVMQRIPAAFPGLHMLPYCVYYDGRDINQPADIPHVLARKFAFYSRTANVRVAPLIYVDLKGCELSMSPKELYQVLLHAFQRGSIHASVACVSFEDCQMPKRRKLYAFLEEIKYLLFVPSFVQMQFTNSCFTQELVEKVLGREMWIKFKNKCVF
jgi:hypothetical protein